jgi:hypothetical protein
MASKGSTIYLGNVHEPLPSKWIIPRLAPLFLLLGSINRSVAQQWTVPACPGNVF